MSGLIPREFIDDLLLRIDLVDLVDTYVPLKKSGSNFVARCPFHTEKTPSFTVNRSKQLFHCFGCGASGNAIGFIMDFNHLDFVEAIEDIASFAGVDVPREKRDSNIEATSKQGDLHAVYEVLEQSANFYSEQMRKHSDGAQVINYLKARGVSGEIARDFLLGYAPDSWNLLSGQFNNAHLQSAGLLGKGKNGKSYDWFRGRLMFPIRDRRGRVVGFGGRVLDDSLPKYLNSPETPVFHKGREVYGLFELLKKKAKPERILLVEGYMDVIALSQFGIDYSVATLGTATSQAHLDLLFRFAKELVFCFDGDQAGQQAAWRATEAALPCLRDGRQVRIMLLPEGEDPDSLIRENGLENFEQGIISALTLSEYFFQHISDGLVLTEIEGQARLVERARPYLKKLPNGVFQAMMTGRLQELSPKYDQDIFAEQAKLKSAGKGLANNKPPKISSARTAITLLLQYPWLMEVAEQKNIDWTGLDLPGVALYRKVLQSISENPKITLAGLLERFRGEPEENQVKLLAQQSILTPESGIEAEFSGALNQWLVQAQDEKLTKLINKAEAQGLDQHERKLFSSMLHKN